MCIIRGIGGEEYIIIIPLSVVVSTSLVDTSVKAWFGFDTITRVVGVVSFDDSVDWDISCSCFVLGSVKNFFLISVCSFVGDDWNIAGLSGDNSLVFS